MSAMTDSRWFVRQPNPQARTRLVCVPHAGGGASAFREWGAEFSSIEVLAAQLPGRECRFGEPLQSSIAPLVSNLADALGPWRDREFALFGHSMGALIAFELARELRRRGGLQPTALIVSGHAAPQLERTRRPLHGLSDAEFVGEIRRLGGTPAEVLENDELMALLLPRLRADFAVCDTYGFGDDAPLTCSVLAFAGRADSRVDRPGLEAWRCHTTGRFASRWFEGGHFYPLESRDALLAALRRELDDTLGDGSRQERAHG